MRNDRNGLAVVSCVACGLAFGATPPLFGCDQQLLVYGWYGEDADAASPEAPDAPVVPDRADGPVADGLPEGFLDAVGDGFCRVERDPFYGEMRLVGCSDRVVVTAREIANPGDVVRADEDRLACAVRLSLDAGVEPPSVECFLPRLVAGAFVPDRAISETSILERAAVLWSGLETTSAPGGTAKSDCGETIGLGAFTAQECREGDNLQYLLRDEKLLVAATELFRVHDDGTAEAIGAPRFHWPRTSAIDLEGWIGSWWSTLAGGATLADESEPTYVIGRRDVCEMPTDVKIVAHRAPGWNDATTPDFWTTVLSNPQLSYSLACLQAVDLIVGLVSDVVGGEMESGDADVDCVTGIALTSVQEFLRDVGGARACGEALIEGRLDQLGQRYLEAFAETVVDLSENPAAALYSCAVGAIQGLIEDAICAEVGAIVGGVGAGAPTAGAGAAPGAAAGAVIAELACTVGPRLVAMSFDAFSTPLRAERTLPFDEAACDSGATPSCGNGICEPIRGEDCRTCDDDCVCGGDAGTDAGGDAGTDAGPVSDDGGTTRLDDGSSTADEAPAVPDASGPGYCGDGVCQHDDPLGCDDCDACTYGTCSPRGAHRGRGDCTDTCQAFYDHVGHCLLHWEPNDPSCG